MGGLHFRGKGGYLGRAVGVFLCVFFMELLLFKFCQIISGFKSINSLLSFFSGYLVSYFPATKLEFIFANYSFLIKTLTRGPLRTALAAVQVKMCM